MKTDAEIIRDICREGELFTYEAEAAFRVVKAEIDALRKLNRQLSATITCNLQTIEDISKSREGKGDKY